MCANAGRTSQCQRLSCVPLRMSLLASSAASNRSFPRLAAMKAAADRQACLRPHPPTQSLQTTERRCVYPALRSTSARKLVYSGCVCLPPRLANVWLVRSSYTHSPTPTFFCPSPSTSTSPTPTPESRPALFLLPPHPSPPLPSPPHPSPPPTPPYPPPARTAVSSLPASVRRPSVKLH